MQKSRIYYEKWLYQQQRPFEENKTVIKSKFSSMEKGPDLSIEMLNYKLQK